MSKMKRCWRYLLEEEVIGDELLRNGGIHAIERVEGTLEVLIENLGGFDDHSHNLESLLLGDTRAERVSSKVSTDSNTGRVDHGGIRLGEFSVLKTLRAHVRNVLVGGAVTMVVLDDLIEKLVELGVGTVGTSIEADTGIEVLDTRVDAGLESDAHVAFLVLVLIPDLRGQVLAKRRLGASREESLEILKIFARLPGSNSARNLARLRSGALNARSGFTTSHCVLYISMIENLKLFYN